MKRLFFAAFGFCALACRAGGHGPAAPPVSAAPSGTATATATATANVSNAPPAPTDTCAPDEKKYGTTCCLPTNAREEDTYPGMVYLHCHGPQVGRPCRKSTDCDVACSCDPDAPLSPRDDALGPPDGTRGAVGRCAGIFQMGVRMCQIDENGVVTHMIVD